MGTTKRFKLTFGILSAGYLLLGLLLLLMPQSSQQVICTVLGIVAIVCGIVRVAYFFLKADSTRVFQNDLAVGAVLLMGGIYLIAWPETVWLLLPVILGFAMVFDAIIKIQYSFELRRLSFSLWWVVLVAALAITVLAVLLVMGTFEQPFLQYYWAVVMLVDGVANLATMALLMLHLRRQAKNEATPEKKRRRDKKAEAETEAQAPTAFEEEPF